MSRIGNKPIAIPEGVQVEVGPANGGAEVRISGPKGKLVTKVRPEIGVTIHDGEVAVERKSGSLLARALHGTVRSLLANAILGVTSGYEKRLTIEGLGYRARVEGQTLTLEVGFSYSPELIAPEGIEIRVESNREIIVNGIDKEVVGEVAAKIRAVRPPEPYKGTGIRYQDEVVRRKAGKTAGSAAGGA